MKSVECKVASTLSEQTAILQQRYDIFVEEFHFLAPREDGKRIEYDEHDKYSLLFGVWKKNGLIASCRLILPNYALGLPTLTNMTIDSTTFRKDESTAEISRILVASEHRIFKKTIKVLQLMQKEINRVSSKYGIVQIIGAVEPSFLHLLNYSKLPYEPIGPLQHHIGPDRYPILLEIKDHIISLEELQ